MRMSAVPSAASARANDGYRSGYGTFDHEDSAPRYDDGRRDASAAREWRERWAREQARRFARTFAARAG